MLVAAEESPPPLDCLDFAMEHTNRIKSIVAEGKQRVAKERDADQNFRSRWENEVRKAVRGVLADTGDGILAEWNVSTAALPENGSERLRVEIDSTEQSFDLWFVPERHDRKVLCKVSENLADRFTAERYELDALDMKTLEEKTASFVEAIFDYLANEGRF